MVGVVISGAVDAEMSFKALQAGALLSGAVGAGVPSQPVATIRTVTIRTSVDGCRAVVPAPLPRMPTSPSSLTYVTPFSTSASRWRSRTPAIYAAC